jgi:hypothetical protein
LGKLGAVQVCTHMWSRRLQNYKWVLVAFTQYCDTYTCHSPRRRREEISEIVVCLVEYAYDATVGHISLKQDMLG